MKALITALLACSLCFFTTGSLLAQELPPDFCAGSISHFRIVHEANHPETLGLSKAEVRRALACIASSRPGGSRIFIPIYAVEALFSIDNREEARDDLIGLILDPDASRVHETALYFLVYVANRSTHDIMLQQLSGGAVPGTRVNYLDYFREVGHYDPFVNWLRQHIANGDPIPESYLKRELRYDGLKDTTDEILRLLEKEDETLDASWLVRMAMKAGASNDAIKKAIFNAMEGKKEPRRMYWVTTAARTYHGRIGFTERDQSTLEDFISEPLVRVPEYRQPEWVHTRIKEAKDEYYGRAWALDPN